MKFIKSKVIFLGNNCAGKNEIIFRAVFNSFEPQPQTTIGSSFSYKRIKYNDIFVELSLWDLAGQNRFRSSCPMYYKEATIVILAFSLTNQNSLDDVKYYADMLKSECDELPSFFLVGNKNDLVDERVISYEQGKKVADELNAIYYEVSAKTGDHIEELIKDIAFESINILAKRLIINSIECNLDYKALKGLQIDNPYPYLTFTINDDDEIKQIQLIKNGINFEINETIDFFIYDEKTDVLKVNMFHKYLNQDIKLMDEIKIPIRNCTGLQINKNIYIKKSFFFRTKVGHISFYLDLIKISDQMPKNQTQIEFKVVDTETIEKLLQIKQKIGSGATSNVYKVKDIFKGDGVLAIKILNSTFFKLMKSTPTNTTKDKNDVWNEDDNNFNDDNEEESEKKIPIVEICKIYKEWEILS